MNKTYKSILDELNEYIMNENKFVNIGTRAEHILDSVVNFCEYVDTHISKEDAELIIDKFISALKNKKPSKFKNFYDKFLKTKERKK